ncbi:hypothetical protein FLM06_18975 [Vibrio cholerae]|nr:hypothetical protein FLM06_18975 [Vibrio cholerae]
MVLTGAANARLRGWQRITTKLKRNNCNHRGSKGPETPRVGSPFEAFVMYDAPTIVANVHGLAHFSECKYYVSA